MATTTDPFDRDRFNREVDTLVIEVGERAGEAWDNPPTIAHRFLVAIEREGRPITLGTGTYAGAGFNPFTWRSHA